MPFVVDLTSAAVGGNNSLRGATVLRFLRLLRLFTLLRVERGLGSFALIHKVLKNKGDELLLTIFVACIILVVSSTLMYYAESEVSTPLEVGTCTHTRASAPAHARSRPHAQTNSSYDSMWISMWWAITALTTVGYGDSIPRRPEPSTTTLAAAACLPCLWPLP